MITKLGYIGLIDIGGYKKCGDFLTFFFRP